MATAYHPRHTQAEINEIQLVADEFDELGYSQAANYLRLYALGVFRIHVKKPKSPLLGYPITGEHKEFFETYTYHINILWYLTSHFTGDGIIEAIYTNELELRPYKKLDLNKFKTGEPRPKLYFTY